MSAIENEAAPFLEPMIRGNPVVLGAEAQRAIASWLALKAIVYRYTQSPLRPVSADTLRYFHRHHLPPQDWYILIMKYIGESPARMSLHTWDVMRTTGQTLRFSVRRYRMLMLIAMGYFAGELVAFEKPMKAIRVRREGWGLQLWPPTAPGDERRIHWPPPKMVGDGHLEHLSQLRSDGMPR